MDTTIVMNPGSRASVDASGCLIIEVSP